MANQEGVKIVITAEDRFTETMKKIDASTKLFGQTAKNTEKNIAALEKEMIRLVSNGMDPADAKIKEMRANYDRLSQSLNNGSLKKSNQQWTNFALVVQDLPYGFRGIQNNLPALVGGFASLTGPIYLVSSAIIALFTAWDAGLFKTTNGISILQAANKEYADSFKQSAGAAGEEIAKINSLVALSSNHEAAMSKRLAAVKKLQDEYPSYFGNLSKEQILNGDVTTSVNNVKNAILERAKATAVASKINKLSAEKFAKEEELYQLALQKTFKIQKAVSYVNQMKALGYDESSKHLKGLIDTQINGIREEENTIKGTVDAIDKELSRLQGIYSGTTPTTIGLDSSGGGAGKKTKVKKEKQDLFDILKATKEFYDAKLNFAEGDETAQRDILLREKQTFDELISSNQISWDDYFKNVSRIYKNLIDFQIKEDKRLFDSQEKFGKSQIDVLKSELGVKLKLNKDNLIGQQDAVRESMAKVAVSMASAFGTGAFPVLLQYYDELNAKLEAMDQNALRGAEAMKQVNSIISSMATDTFVIFAENLGKALAGENVDLFGSFASMMGSGLQEIGKALIAYGLAMDAFKKAFSNPFAAVAAGVALIAAGAYLKSSIAKTSGGGSGDGVQTFANGGIVSGPTMGLMGEYPGAKSNPEVIAPLDKLKDLIGGNGGGTFVLRGQDLLLSVNRAQKASNLKGQNINLA